MAKFIVYALLILVFVFLFVLLSSLMVWVVTKVLRSLFPSRFAPDKARAHDEA